MSQANYLRSRQIKNWTCRPCEGCRQRRGQQHPLPLRRLPPGPAPPGSSGCAGRFPPARMAGRSA